MKTNIEQDQVATIGIDTGKNTLHLIGLNSQGKIVLKQKISRVQASKMNRPSAMSSVRPRRSLSPSVAAIPEATSTAEPITPAVSQVWVEPGGGTASM